MIERETGGLAGTEARDGPNDESDADRPVEATRVHASPDPRTGGDADADGESDRSRVTPTAARYAAEAESTKSDDDVPASLGPEAVPADDTDGPERYETFGVVDYAPREWGCR